MSRSHKATLPVVRCALYTRKSTEEGLQQEFNSLDAQREAAEAYVASQRHEGWSCLPDRYDDPGFSGGNLERPALKRLLADIQAGKVDCVVVYKVDRLSRSLLDFTRLMDVLDRHKVAFVSVTQQFNTASSMGRLVLNVLLSFAQFERELISERTRDKMSATRKKGKYAGGRPPLGYDVDRSAKKLVLNPDEAHQVRTLFTLYLEYGSLLPVVQDVQKRGWHNKGWTAKNGKSVGGEPFTRTNLHRLLTNPVYLGQVRYKGEIYPGEHPPLIDADIWDRTQALLTSKHRGGGGQPTKGQPGALLRGLLRCGCCGKAMTPTCTHKGSKRYRYYSCGQALKNGAAACPSRSVPAGEIERAVVQRLQALGRDSSVITQSITQARLQDQQQLADLEAERRSLGKDLTRWNDDLRPLALELARTEDATAILDRLTQTQQRIAQGERRLLAIAQHMQSLRSGLLHEADAALALERFGPVWEVLQPHEQARLVRLVLQRVDYDGHKGSLAITFHPTGVRTLAEEIQHHHKPLEKHA